MEKKIAYLIEKDLIVLLCIRYLQEALNVLVWIFVGSSFKLARVLHQLDYSSPQLKIVRLNCWLDDA